jgi:prevent-host-death family protein
MKTITVTELRGNIFKLLDGVLRTGAPIEVNKGVKKVRIVPAQVSDKLRNLVSRPDVINGDPEDIVNTTWEKEAHNARW